MKENLNLLTSQGTFFTGCNYWASHSGAAMWSDWKADVVESDFKKMSEEGIKILRVFPLWSDFQPITHLKGAFGRPVEYRIGEESLSDDDEGRAGVSKTAILHFEELTVLAGKFGLKLIVGLITGWMSGRLFVPPALEGRNVLVDQLAIQWEVRFVKYFVSRFNDYPVIIAWDLGNECNCMGEITSAETAWNWISIITNAIKSVDSVRPVVSGMHSLKTEGNWTIQDQAEVTDVLTTHPYPLFTPYCDQDPINTIRIGLHAVSETLFYRGIGNKPCFVEEMGTLGQMIASEEVGADYIRNNLFTLWAHDCRGFLWWCAYEQSHLVHAPYDWISIERELGLFKMDGSPKPVLGEMEKFNEFVEGFRYGILPERIVDGICILTNGQDTWGAAYSSFVLAKQAGLDIEYQYASQPIKVAKIYLMPSIKGIASISRHRMNELLEKVRDGAVLYISSDDGLLSPFSEYSGIKVLTRQKSSDVDIVAMNGDVKLDLRGSYKFKLETINAEIIGTDQDGNPAFTCARYGKGKVFFLNYPVETYLLDKPNAFHGKDARPYWTIYRYLKESITTTKVIFKFAPNIGITEHIYDENKRVIVVINYDPVSINAEIRIDEGWRISESLYGESSLIIGNTGNMSIAVNKNDAVVFTIIFT